MFNIFKKNTTDFLVRSEIFETKVIVSFFLKKNNQFIQLPLDKQTRAELSKNAPKRAASFFMMESFLNNLSQDFTPDHEFGAEIGFEVNEISESPISFVNGSLHLSYPFIYAVHFSETDVTFGISPEHLNELKIPNYSVLSLEITAKGDPKISNFKLFCTIKDRDGNLIEIKDISGSLLVDTSGRKHILLPSQAVLLRAIQSHKEIIKQPAYTENQSVRLEELAKIRDLAISAKAKLPKAIRDQNIIVLSDIEYEIARGLDDEIMVIPVMPPQHAQFDLQLQNGIQALGDSLDGKALNFQSSEVKNVRVVIKKKAQERIKQINAANDLPQEELERVILDPTATFGSKPRVMIAELFSKRVGTLIFGKGAASSESKGKGVDWSDGFEGNSVFFRDTNGIAHKFDPNPTPQLYEAMKKALNATEDAAKLAGSKVNDNEEIYVEGFQSKIHLRTISDICRRVESINVPTISDEEVESAKLAIEKANIEGEYVVNWIFGESTRQIPVESLKRALPKHSTRNSESQLHSVTLSSLPIDDSLVEVLESQKTWAWNDPLLYDEVIKPSAFNDETTLMGHQKVGSSWLKFLSLNGPEGINGQRGAVMADDMGVGKTIQVLAFIASLLEGLADKKAAILIVAPISLIRTSWMKDGFLNFFKASSIRLMGAGDGPEVVYFDDCPFKIDKKKLNQEAREWKDKIENQGFALSECEISNELKSSIDNVANWIHGKILLCSYESLRINSLVLGSVNFKAVVLDEAQKIKNENALQANAAKALKSEMNIAMSGTPIENSLMDLWNLIDFAVPGKLGTKDKFREMFVTPLKESENDLVLRAQIRKKLEDDLEPIWLRRTKKDVFGSDPDFPKIVYHDAIEASDGSIVNEHMVAMSEIQFNLYSDAASYMKEVSSGEKLATRSKMVQLCVAPWLYLGIEPIWENHVKLFEVCPKLAKLISILDIVRLNSESDGKKVLLFVNLIDVQMSLSTFISDWYQQVTGQSIKVYIFNGEVASSERDERIRAFKSGEGFQVLIISPRSGGVGLNLQEANHVIHYTREWNPAVEAQATARAYRMKQKRTVHVYYPTTTLQHKVSATGKSLVCAEEHIAEVLRNKREVMEDFTVSVSDLNVNMEDFDNSTLESFEEKDVEIKYQDLSSLDPIDFEKLVAVVLQNKGYKVEWVGQSRDRGADVLAFSEGQNLLIQCKHTSRGNLVPESAVGEPRQADSVYSKNRQKHFDLILVTNHRFSERCYTYAEEGTKVHLWDSKWFIEHMSGQTIMLSDLRKIRKVS